MTDTNNTDVAALLPVTQSDREAAAGLIAWHNKAASDWKTDGGNDLTFFAADMPYAIRKGVWDNHDVVQAFARHRQSHSLPGDVGMREALKDLLKWADNVCAAQQFGPQKAVARARAALAHPAQATPSALSGDAGEGE